MFRPRHLALFASLIAITTACSGSNPGPTEYKPVITKDTLTYIEMDDDGPIPSDTISLQATCFSQCLERFTSTNPGTWVMFVRTRVVVAERTKSSGQLMAFKILSRSEPVKATWTSEKPSILTITEVSYSYTTTQGLVRDRILGQANTPGSVLVTATYQGVKGSTCWKFVPAGTSGGNSGCYR